MSFIKVLLLFSSFHLIRSYEISAIEVIKDFVDKQPPVKILAFLECWSQGHKVKFVRTMKTIPISILAFNGTIQLLEIPNQQLFVIDSTCSNYKGILDEANTCKLLGSPFRWIFIGSVENIRPYLNILTDSRFYILEKEPDLNRNYYSLKTIYKISSTDTEYIQNGVAIWDEKFLYYNELSDTANRSNLMGSIINVSFVVTNPDTLNHIWDYRNRHIDTVTKINYLLCYYLLEVLNATANFIPSPTWGYKNMTTGMFNGMIGELQTGRAELGGTITFITSDRLYAVDYLAPTSDTTVAFVFRAPPLSYVTNVFTLPFTRGVWYAIFGLMGLLSIILYIVVKWEWAEEEFNRDVEINRSMLLPDFGEVIIVNLGGVSQQGSEQEPRSSSGRIVYLFGFIAMMFLYTSYSANIVALLQSRSDSISTVEDLLYSGIKLGVEMSPYTTHYFESFNDPIRKAIYKQKIAPKGSTENFIDVPGGVKKIREEFFGLHAITTQIYKFVAETFLESEKCTLREIQILQERVTELPAKKNTSYKEILKVGFVRMIETGIRNREYTKLFNEKPTCQGVGGTFADVGLNDCYYPFMIFGVGCAMSLILLILEIFVHRKRERLQRIYEEATERIMKRHRVKRLSN